MIPAGTKLGGVQVVLGAAPVVGQVDALGRMIQLGKLDGWWDPAATSGESTQKVNDHGVFLTPAFYGPRVVQLEARIDGFSPADSLAVAQLLEQALSLDSLTTLSVTDENETLTAQVRQEGDPLLARQGNRVVVSLSMLAPDPRRYTGATTVSTGLPASTGGLVLPTILPFSLNAGLTTGDLTIVNAGDVDSFPVFTVSGPCSAFTITDGAGRSLAFAGTVDTGRTLVMDSGARTALLDGTAIRTVTGTWPRLAPGSNTIRFRATTYDPASLLSVTYRSARR